MQTRRCWLPDPPKKRKKKKPRHRPRKRRSNSTADGASKLKSRLTENAGASVAQDNRPGPSSRGGTRCSPKLPGSNSRKDTRFVGPIVSQSTEGKGDSMLSEVQSIRNTTALDRSRVGGEGSACQPFNLFSVSSTDCIPAATSYTPDTPKFSNHLSVFSSKNVERNSFNIDRSSSYLAQDCDEKDPPLKRSTSTASTVLLGIEDDDELDEIEDIAKAEDKNEADTNRRSPFEKLLGDNLLMSVKNHIDSIGDESENAFPIVSASKQSTDKRCGVETELSSFRTVESGSSSASISTELKCAGENQDVVDAGADLDRFSTHSCESSVADSGMGSSQDMCQESSQECPELSDRLSAAPVESPKKSNTLGGRKNKDADRSSHRRSSSVSVRVEFDIGSGSDGGESVTSKDRATKRKRSSNDFTKQKKKKSSSDHPLSKYMDESLCMVNEDTDVFSLPESNSVRIISTALSDFIRSKDGQHWMLSDGGRSWTSSAPVQAMLQASLLGGGGGGGSAASSFGDNLCMVCQDRPKDAAIIHGKISHQTTCYKCAKTLFQRKQRCPVCRRKILRIAKNIIV